MPLSIVAALIGALLLTGVGSRQETAVTELPMVTYSPTQQETIEWALAQFERVDLEVPDVEIRFFATREGCGNNEGLYRRVEGQHVVFVCKPDGASHHRKMQQRRTLVHELAHAWEQEYLDEHDREELLAVLQADVWISADVAWPERGAERFAETIVWGLYDQKSRPLLIDQACGELHRNFVAITGHTAVGPVNDTCRLMDTP